MQLTGCITVSNVPEYAIDKEIWVCTFDPDSKEFWFYGAWDSIDEGNFQAALDESYFRCLVYNPKFVNDMY